MLNKLEEIINEFELLKSKAKYQDLSGDVKPEEMKAVISKTKAAVVRIVGINSEYYKDVTSALDQRIPLGLILREIIGTVIALKSDLQNDYLKKISDLIQSEVFSNYLEMAEYLLNEGYKDASAVLIASTLEGHLRELCKANEIDLVTLNSTGKTIPKKADLMNADLTKADIYSTSYQKQIIAWLSLRNSAAHGHYASYTSEEIKLMLLGVRQFVVLST